MYQLRGIIWYVPAKGRWCSVAGKVTAGVVESNGSLPPGVWFIVTYRLTARGQLRAQCSITSMGTLLPNGFSESIVFWGCPSAQLVQSSIHSSTGPERYYYHDVSGMTWAISVKLNREYSLATTDDLIRFWRLEVKGQGHSRLSRWRRHPSRRLFVEVQVSWLWYWFGLCYLWRWSIVPKWITLVFFDMRVTMEDSHVILNGNLDQPTGRETSPRRWVVGGNYLHPERFTLLH